MAWRAGLRSFFCFSESGRATTCSTYSPRAHPAPPRLPLNVHNPPDTERRCRGGSGGVRVAQGSVCASSTFPPLTARAPARPVGRPRQPCDEQAECEALKQKTLNVRKRIRVERVRGAEKKTHTSCVDSRVSLPLRPPPPPFYNMSDPPPTQDASLMGTLASWGGSAWAAASAAASSVSRYCVFLFFRVVETRRQAMNVRTLCSHDAAHAGGWDAVGVASRARLFFIRRRPRIHRAPLSRVRATGGHALGERPGPGGSACGW